MSSYRFLLIALAAALFTQTATAQAIYKTVDEDGNVTYTDQAQRGAEQVEVPPVSVAPTRSVTTNRNNQSQSQSRDNNGNEYSTLQERYGDFSLVSPSEDENLWGTGQSLQIRVSNNEALLPNLNYVYFINDAEVHRGSNNSVTVDSLDRGEHQVRVEIQTANGRTVTSAGPTTFYIKQNSRQFNN